MSAHFVVGLSFPVCFFWPLSQDVWMGMWCFRSQKHKKIEGSCEHDKGIHPFRDFLLPILFPFHLSGPVLLFHMFACTRHGLLNHIEVHVYSDTLACGTLVEEKRFQHTGVDICLYKPATGINLEKECWIGAKKNPEISVCHAAWHDALHNTTQGLFKLYLWLTS